MISQFVSSHNKRLLGELDFDFPEGIHALGRLDDDSEGLLILTTDKSMTRILFNPEVKHKRNYVVQVEKRVGEAALHKLRTGMEILVKLKGVYMTKPCEVNIIEKPHWLPERAHEFRADLPQTWMEMILTEGRNRQIRKMCAGVYHPCKRLIRTKIEDLSIEGMQPGEVKELSKEELFAGLHIKLPVTDQQSE
jgi:23S rRNA pseudouridine2457 synthase